jgi:hypothetical protein
MHLYGDFDPSILRAFLWMGGRVDFFPPVSSPPPDPTLTGNKMFENLLFTPGWEQGELS